MNFKLKKTGITAAAGLMCLSSLPCHASPDDGLIDALVQKGVLSPKEAAEIRDKTMTEVNTSDTAKVINFSSAIKNLTLYGDVRLRAEIRDGSYGPGEVNANNGTLYSSGGSEGRDRLRYRFRMGLNGDLYDNFFFGVGISSNPYNQRAGNVTFGDSGSSGPFGKEKGIVAINRVFIGWRPTDYLTVEAGQIDNPFYSTNLTWDPGIQPTGFAEQFQKDVCNVNLFANAGQFIYQAPSFTDSSVTPGLNYSNVFMLEEQIGLKAKITKDIDFKAAIGITSYTGTRTTSTGGTSASGTADQTETGSYSAAPLVLTGNGQQPNDFSGPFTGGAADPISNNYGINNLLVLDAPAELNFKLDKVPVKIFGDFAVNLDADARSQAAATAVSNGTAVTPIAGGATAATLLSSTYFKNLNRDNGGQDLAYEAGIQVGQLKDKGDWMGKVSWVNRGYYSVDPNLTDVDVFDGRVNLAGIVVAGNYQITKGLVATVTYMQASRADKQLATPGTGQDLNIDPIDQYRNVDVDLTWKF